MRNQEIFLIGIAIFSNISFAAPQVVDKVAAIVNDDVILESDADIVFKLMKVNAIQSDQKIFSKSALRSYIIDRLIMDQIILQIGHKTGVNISEKQLDDAINSIARHHNISLSQIRKRLTYQGIDYSDYRNQVRKELLISAVQNNEIGRRISILPQEVEILAEQISEKNNFSAFNLNYILILFPEKPTLDQIKEAKKRALSFTERVRRGEKFHELISNSSSDYRNQKILKNGQIGWIRVQEMPYFFRKSLIEAKKGDIIGPIRSKAGFYILEVKDISDQNQNNFFPVTEVHARHILLKTSPIMNDDQVRIKLEQISSEIRSGKISFVNAAKKFSEDFNTASQGGDLGWIIADAYDSNFRDILTKLSKGQISAPIQSCLGWHLVEILDSRNVNKINAIRKEQAYQILFNQKFSEEIETWMQEQRFNAYTKILG